MHICVAAAVAVYRHRKERVEVIAQLAPLLGLLDEEDAIMSKDGRKTYL